MRTSRPPEFLNARVVVGHLGRESSLSGHRCGARALSSADERSLGVLVEETDEEREDYATQTPARRVERRYVKPGDTLIVVLPHPENCRNQWLAGRPTRLTVGEADAELDLTTCAPDTGYHTARRAVRWSQ
jgi:hypothetical protein